MNNDIKLTDCFFSSHNRGCCILWFSGNQASGLASGWGGVKTSVDEGVVTGWNLNVLEVPIFSRWWRRNLVWKHGRGSGRVQQPVLIKRGCGGWPTARHVSPDVTRSLPNLLCHAPLRRDIRQWVRGRWSIGRAWITWFNRLGELGGAIGMHGHSWKQDTLKMESWMIHSASPQSWQAVILVWFWFSLMLGRPDNLWEIVITTSRDCDWPRGSLILHRILLLN